MAVGGFFKPSWRRASDGDLARASARKDAKAFAELIRRYQDPVFRFARQYLGDAQGAEDVCQEAFLRLFQSLENRPDIAVRPYVFSIARNLCCDQVRKKRPENWERPPEMVDGKTPLELLNKRQGLDALSRAVDQLPESQKTVILLRHTRELSYAQIAQAMETTVPAVESLLIRARKKIKTMLQPS